MKMKMKRVVSWVVTVYASVPVLIYLFPWILSHAVFSHLWRIPFFVDLSRPELVLNHTCSFHLHPEEGVSVGVWHTLPASQWEAAAGKSPEWYQEALGDGSPVIIYLHGNAGTRALSHRVALVKRLSAAGYHVFALDYRGFGDSAGEPTEAGLTTDALYLHQWVKTQSGGSVVCVWGHSLGSGVATNAAVKLQQQGSALDALILDGAFTNLVEAAIHNPLAKIYSFLPGFNSLMEHLLKKIQIAFPSDENLKTVTSPLLILHAEDDHIIPYSMGQKLHEIAVRARQQHDWASPAKMVPYGAELKYSHDGVATDPDLINVVGGFLQKLKQ